MPVTDRIKAIAPLEPKEKQEAYIVLVDELIGANSVDGLVQLARHLCTESVPLQISRVVISALTERLRESPDDVQQAVIEATLAAFEAERRSTTFEEQISVLYTNLSKVHERAEDWAAAARALSLIPIDTGVRTVPVGDRIGIYLRMAELHLENDDPVSAETELNRASRHIGDATDPLQQLRYKVSYARILDSKRKFYEASVRYYELSSTVPMPAERIEALGYSVICAVLASAGPNRSRMLATLYKDEQCRQLDTFPTLEKVYLDRILPMDDFKTFESKLRDHQKAKMSDGQTVLERAVIEHNMLAASRIYDNIRFDELGLVLGTSADNAEAVAAKMVREKRLTATIDQIEGVVVFTENDATAAWDDQIRTTCELVQSTAETIAARFPQLVAE